MIRKEGSTGSFIDRLGVRLAIFLAVALFPLLLISAIQSNSLLQEARARSEAALMGETLQAVTGETRLLQQAQAEARFLAYTLPPLLGDMDACSAQMRKVVEADPALSLAAFVDKDGQMECSSRSVSYDFSNNKYFQKLLPLDTPNFILNPHGPVSGTAVIGATHPVYDKDGHKLGFVSLSLPHSSLLHRDHENDTLGYDVDNSLMILTFDTSGAVLTSSGDLALTKDYLPAHRALKALAGTNAVTFTARANSGQERVYSVLELLPGQLYAMGSWPAKASISMNPIADVSPILVPGLMWLASLLVAYFAMQKLVIGHIKRLSRALRGFASGSRRVGNLNYAGAPKEIQDLALSYEKMTETILHDEAELEDMIHHQEVLLREVHHRVKNNLQLIASIISMQIRKARSPEAKDLMKGLQERVISLATIHRGLYQTSGLTDITANELLPDIVRQISALATGPERRIDIGCHVDEIRLTPDQAVPLSLLLTEAMTNAMKYAGTVDGSRPDLQISLRKTRKGYACLALENSVDENAPPASPDTSSGLGSQLAQAFVQQLNGDLQSSQENGRYRLTAEFKLAELQEAELRHARDDEDDDEDEEEE
ncbi:sensor histidine kinase [Thioclava sp. GXIMD4215]|uniref:sensor histidine kinase n=1 Tax=Thioclava sp. GXIMD4215 TaxID=3131928 RepID=UPI00324D021C